MSEWNPAKTAPVDIDLIVYVPGVGIGVGVHYEGKWKYADADGIYFDDAEVTHWMPLPAPPEST